MLYLPNRSGPRWKYPPAAGVSGKLISRPPPHEEKQIFPPTSSAPLRDAVGRNRRAPGEKGVLRPLTPRSKDVAAGTRANGYRF